MNVYTYYTDTIDGLYDSRPTSLGTAESQRELLKVWERSWAKQGWTPVVLTEADARKHPRFDFFNEHFVTKPTQWGVPYTLACFIRWLCMSQVGGGMLTDYDSICYSFPPQEIPENEMHIFSDDPPANIRMGAVLGSAQHYLDMAEIFAATKASEYDWKEKEETYHQDDESLIQRMFNGTLDRPAWLKRVPGCALFPHPTWTTAPMVHFAYGMKTAGYWPKFCHIEQLRPF